MKELKIVPLSSARDCCGTAGKGPVKSDVSGIVPQVDALPCRCGDATAESPGFDYHWIEGKTNTPIGEVPAVGTGWTWRDHLGQFRSRTGNARMNYLVPPGLYAAGKPDACSEVMVSANYKLSFDLLRRVLKEINTWILVLDTKGINVWCAAGKGSFGTDELIFRVLASGLERVVSHRRLIVPQLGAPGVEAHEVENKTGFRVLFGPVRAEDIPAYMKNDFKKTRSMSTVTFSLKERLVLVPMELIPALRVFVPAAVAVMALMGLERQGIMFGSITTYGFPVLLIGLVAILSGAFFTPLILPLIPVRSFALKGLSVGLVLAALLSVSFEFMGNNGWVFSAFALTFLPLASSYLALQFTGATVFTGMSGVKKEIKISLPLYVAGAILSVLLLLAYKLSLWGIP